MKQITFIIAFLCTMCLNAQTIQTHSSCDSNTDGNVNVADVSNIVNKVLGKTAKSNVVVTADNIMEVLAVIEAQLDELVAIQEDMSLIEDKTGKHKGREFVDLGLSVKWATMNVGATEVAGSKINSHTGKLDCYGEYYAWGETSPKDTYDWTTYTLCNGSKTSMTKYCTDSSYGTVDNKTTLELADDVAHANWGGSWRMPTKAEQDELRKKCYWEWTISYNNSGVKGYIIYKAKNDSDKGVMKYSGSSTTTSASYSLSDTHIFLPAAGYRKDSSFNYVGSSSAYKSSSLASKSQWAYEIDFSSSSVYSEYLDRYYGQSVRPVCP